MSLVLVNGVVVGSANSSVIIGGVVVTGIKQFAFKKSQKKENVMGFQNQPVGRGRGAYEYSGLKMTILLEEWKSIVAAAPNRDPMKIPMFSVPFVYDNNALQQDTLNNCEFTDSARSISAGDTAQWVDVDMIFAGLSE